MSAQTKRKYEVDVVDREFCRKVNLALEVINIWSLTSMKLRSEEIELRDRNSVLRSSAGGKANVSYLSLIFLYNPGSNGISEL